MRRLVLTQEIAVEVVPDSETFKKNSLIDGIESNRQINKSKRVDLLMIHGLDDAIMHRKKSSFNKIMFDVG
jgi:hypothetical protein